MHCKYLHRVTLHKRIPVNISLFLTWLPSILWWNQLIIFIFVLLQNKWYKSTNSNLKQENYLKIIIIQVNQNLIEVMLTIKQLWGEKFAVCRKLSKDYQILSENFTFQSHTCRNMSYCDSPVVHISSKVKMKSVSELLYLQTLFCKNFHTHLTFANCISIAFWVEEFPASINMCYIYTVRWNLLKFWTF